ncbi:MAG: alpha/beta fold hydrolase [Actinomycetota bacterium]|jgi:uncharacterized protein
MSVSRLRLLTALLAVAMVATACSGGGGDALDPTEGDLIDGQRLVSFSGDGGLKLGGTLGVPDGGGPAPGVLIIPSLDPRLDRDGIASTTDPDLVYEDISKALNAAGMVTLRYDRRGVGASKLESGSDAPTYEQVQGDARGALAFLAQRGEVGGSPLAVLGHDVGGWTALALAAEDPKVKGVVLVSTPGRPLVDVYAEGFRTSHGPASAERFRQIVAGLLSTGSLPDAEQISPEHQSVLGQGQAEMLRGAFADSPLADVAKVKVPVLVAVGTTAHVGQTIRVGRIDADTLASALGPQAQVAMFDLGPTLLPVPPDPGVPRFDPDDDSTHVGGARTPIPVVRDPAALGRLASFLTGSLRS